MRQGLLQVFFLPEFKQMLCRSKLPTCCNSRSPRHSCRYGPNRILQLQLLQGVLGKLNVVVRPLKQCSGWLDKKAVSFLLLSFEYPVYFYGDTISFMRHTFTDESLSNGSFFTSLLSRTTKLAHYLAFGIKKNWLRPLRDSASKVPVRAKQDMKINGGRFSETVPPFNEVYDAFEPLFISLFEQRQLYQRAGDAAGYVPMPEVETRLNNFVQSGSTELCLFVGPIGIGKSSVLRHLAATNWGKRTDTETIFIDLSRRKAILPNLSEAESLSQDTDPLAVNRRIDAYIAAELESHMSGRLNFNEEVENLYAFVWENNRELLMPHATFGPTSIEERAGLLRYLQSEKRIPFLFVLLKYYALAKQLKNLVIVVDNCDQKDSILIEGFIDTLCHLDRCFEHIEGPYDWLPRLTCVISCRPSTRWLADYYPPPFAYLIRRSFLHRQMPPISCNFLDLFIPFFMIPKMNPIRRPALNRRNVCSGFL